MRRSSRILGQIPARRAGDDAAAGRLLVECAALALSVERWEGRPDHATYVARLRQAHPRKAALARRADKLTTS